MNKNTAPDTLYYDMYSSSAILYLRKYLKEQSYFRMSELRTLIANFTPEINDDKQLLYIIIETLIVAIVSKVDCLYYLKRCNTMPPLKTSTVNYIMTAQSRYNLTSLETNLTSDDFDCPFDYGFEDTYIRFDKNTFNMEQPIATIIDYAITNTEKEIKKAEEEERMRETAEEIWIARERRTREIAGERERAREIAGEREKEREKERERERESLKTNKQTNKKPVLFKDYFLKPLYEFIYNNVIIKNKKKINKKIEIDVGFKIIKGGRRQTKRRKHRRRITKKKY